MKVLCSNSLVYDKTLTTPQLCLRIAQLNKTINYYEARHRSGKPCLTTLRSLHSERTLLVNILMTRRLEAGKKVVDFRMYRDGSIVALAEKVNRGARK